MKRRESPVTMVSPSLPAAVSGLAALAFGSASIGLGEGKHLAFLPLDALELDLTDPEQRDFGDYELIEQLGQGGMGVVYRAYQKSLQREVALKLLSAGPWASPEFIGRFQREAQSAARLQHPNIVSIFEIGQHAELNFFSMQLVRGQSLAQRLDDGGPLPPREAAKLVRTIAEALDYAHRLGILHLDLKPANVLIDEHAEPQVADFGLAKRLDESLASDGDEVSGTPSYMAPEQATAKSQRIGVATDIYGIGAILYELLTGRPPFLGATPRQTLEHVVAREVEAPRQYVRSIPEDLDAICLKCLAKDPAQRYVTARGLAEDLGRFLDGRAVSVRPLHGIQRLVRWARREPRVALAAGGALLALVAGLAATSLQWRRADANALDARENLWVARAQAAQGAMANGDAFRGLRALVENLREMEAAGRDADAEIERQRIGTALANAPQLVDLMRLDDGLYASALALAPNGQRLAVTSFGNGVPRRVHEFDLDSGVQRWETSTDGLTRGLPFASMMPHGRVQYTPDGSHMLVHPMQNAPFPGPTMSDALLLGSATGEVLLPEPLPTEHSDFVFSEDGAIALQRVRRDATSRFPDAGQLVASTGWRVLGPMLPHGVERGWEWIFAPDGSGLLGSGDFVNLTYFAPATLEPRWRFALDAGAVRAWRFSRDGDHLALGTTTGAVWLLDVADGRARALASTPASTVRWVEFNEDASVLAVRAEDGTLMAWDVASGKPRMSPVRHSRLGGYERLRLVGDTLYAVAENELWSFELVPGAPLNLEAVPASARPSNRRNVMSGAFDIDPLRRRLAVGGSDGVIGLWQLPRPPLLVPRAAPLPTIGLEFDGERVYAVEGRSVRAVDVVTQQPLSPDFVHPLPVRLAVASVDGRALATVAGRTVRVFDLEQGTLRGAPWLLPQTPLRAERAAAADTLLFTTAEYVGDAYHERLQVLDLATGRPRDRQLLLPGPVRGLALDPRGRFALANMPGAAAEGQPPSHHIEVLELDGSARKCSRKTLGTALNPLRTVIAPDGESAWTYASTPERRGHLVRWRTTDCTTLQQVVVQQGAGGNFLRARGEGVVVNQLVTDALSMFAPDGSRRQAPGLPLSSAMLEFALSRDGRRAALATRNAVHLVDLERGERLSAALAAPIASNDAIAQLAFGPDARRLLARTVHGRWLAWDLPTASESSDDLARLTAMLDPEGSDAELSPEEFDALRRLLHSRAVPEAPRGRAVGFTAVEFAAVEGEIAETPFLALDLRALINAPLRGAWPLTASTGGDLPTLATGYQRFNDVDFRVDGIVQLNGGGPATFFGDPLPLSAPLPLPAVPVRRVHLLARLHVPIGARAPARLAAQVLLRGADGREHRLDVMTRRHLVPSAFFLESALLPGARVAWRGASSAGVRSGTVSSTDFDDSIYAIALDVPADAGSLESLRLGIGDGPMEAPQVFAVTLEMRAAATGSFAEPSR